jgi:glycosyltransferase involved in cell wall biosynthesis
MRAVGYRPVRVLIFHGYLLRGTGSNVYNASLVRALAGMGHEVHLLCQDRHAAELEWVDRAGNWDGGELEIETTGGSSPGAGSVTVYRPDIRGLLPVYVKDEYEGFRVKSFPELDDAELDVYLGANVAAVREVAEVAGGIDVALANHLIMGPLILSRSRLPFVAKVHGSALEYTVKPNPERFLPYAREGMRAARAVLVGSVHTAESLWAAIDDPELRAKTKISPPGVDTELFAPLVGESPAARLRGVARGLSPSTGGAWGRDPARASRALNALSEAQGPRVIFVGKLIVSKGIDLLLAAWPLVVAEHPGARLLVVGFGEYAGATERLWKAIEHADLDDLDEIARRGRSLEGGEDLPLRYLTAFLGALPDGYAEAAREAQGSVQLAGRLEHDEVGEVIPACDALVFPSTFPEAFGMVAAEAAAAEVPPVSANHSGAAEVSRELAAVLPPDLAGLVSFDLDDGAVVAIASRLNGWLGLDPERSAAARAQLRETAARLWSWEGVGQAVIDACIG